MKKIVVIHHSNLIGHKLQPFVKFLRSFYDTTLKFSASLSVTFNDYVQKLHNIQTQLVITIFDDPIMNVVAKSMKSKFDKHWSDVNKMYKILFIVLVLDLQFKLNFSIFCV